MNNYTVSPYLDINGDSFFTDVITAHTTWIETEQAMAKASGQALAALTFFSYGNKRCALFHVSTTVPIYIFVTPEEGEHIEYALDQGQRQVIFNWGTIEIAYDAST